MHVLYRGECSHAIMVILYAWGTFHWLKTMAWVCDRAYKHVVRKPVKIAEVKALPYVLWSETTIPTSQTFRLSTGSLGKSASDYKLINYIGLIFI